jgi:tetratricopeptide (TPR) repeat protein
MFRKSLFACLAVGLFATCSGAPIKPEHEVFESAGIVSSGRQADTYVWFELDRIDQHFVMYADNVTDASTLAEILGDSSKTGRSIVVRYEVEGGTDDTGTKPSYIVRRVSYNGVWHDGEPPGSQQRSAVDAINVRDPAVSDLAAGVALYNEGDDGRALKALSEALSAPSLPKPLVTLALKSRGGAYSDLASAESAGEKQDADQYSAIKDFAAWRQADPRSAEAAEAYADALAALGAYDEALAAYDNVLGKWPVEFDTAKIRQGAILRRLGKYEEALARLDELVAKKGPQDGMRYHYHRGWTLVMLGRYDDADHEFTEGLRTQPDYAWAFLLRACARSQLGRFSDAISDQDEGTELLKAAASVGVQSAAIRKDIERSESVGDHLRQLANAHKSQSDDEACKGYVDFPSRPRDRSPLLKQLPM